jgi:demethylmenaquinone methyltransferase/2-methoxy-6-polyprenyl-1,4-benzoquinol methylase
MLGRAWRQRRLEPVPESYLALAEGYQRRTTLFPGWHELLVARTETGPGDTVVDVGCGPGLNFAALQTAVGPTGTIIGIEESPELLSVAAHQVARRGWDNVQLIHAPPGTVDLPVFADAALFSATPEVLGSAPAVANILAQLRPGAGVATGGWKLPSRWLWPLRICVNTLRASYPGHATGFDEPWRLLAEDLSDVTVSTLGFGTGYLAHTHTRPPPRGRHRAPRGPG